MPDTTTEEPQELTRELLTEYIRWIANRLGLRDWILTLMRQPSEDDCIASVNLTYGRKLAQIYVAWDILERDPAEIRETVIHELLHVHYEPAFNQAQNDLLHVMGDDTHSLFMAAFRRQVEYATDGLAAAIAPLFPLPTGEYGSGQDRWWLPDPDGEGSSYRCTLKHCPGPDPDDSFTSDGQADA